MSCLVDLDRVNFAEAIMHLVACVADGEGVNDYAETLALIGEKYGEVSVTNVPDVYMWRVALGMVRIVSDTRGINLSIKNIFRMTLNEMRREMRTWPARQRQEIGGLVVPRVPPSQPVQYKD